MSDLLWNALLICGPLLALTLVVGLVISILQVVTQVQDMSLTFIPKVVVSVVALTIFGPWMLRMVLKFATTVISDIPGYF